ncbi:hypothetical protein ABIE49_000785 [Bradyrhizobium sp. OAE829]
MCETCDEINVKIAHLRDVSRRMLDQQTLDGIAQLILEHEAQKAALHSE